MINVEALRKKLNDLKAAMRAIIATAEQRDDKRMSETEAADWSAKDLEAKDLEGQISRAVRMNELEMADAEGSAGDNGVPDSRDEGSGEKPKFASLGEQLIAIRNDALGIHHDNRLDELRAATGAGTQDPTNMGYLVESDKLSEIVKNMVTESVLAGACRKVGISGPSNALKWNSVDETSRATGSRWGGVNAYWAAEAATVTATGVKLGRSSLELEKLMAIWYATEELMQDASAASAIATQAVSEEFAWLLDDAIISGTGAGRPLGLLNADATVEVAKETAQAADTVVWENILNMWVRMAPRSKGSASWYINPDVEKELATMAFTIGTGGIPVYMPAAGVSGAPYSTLYGRPVVPIEQAKALGDKGDIIFADLSQYLLIDKGGMDTAQSMHVRFVNAEETFRFMYRVNGTPLWKSAITPADGSTNTRSPFVTLAARA